MRNVFHISSNKNYLQSFWLLLIFILSLSSDVHATVFLIQNISMRITAEKDTFAQFEDIYFSLIITNLSSREIVIDKPNRFRNCELIVTDSQGKKIQQLISFDYLRGTKTETISIDGNDSLEVNFDLGGFINDDLLLRAGGGLKPGNYNIQISFMNVLSDAMNITVRHQDVSESQITDRIISKIGGTSDEEGAVREAESVIEDYPNSVYIPKVYRWLMLHLNNIKTEDGTKLCRVADDFISRYPSSPSHIKSAVSYFIKGTKKQIGVDREKQMSKNEKEMIAQKLMELRRKHGLKKLSEIIDQRITQLKIND